MSDGRHLATALRALAHRGWHRIVDRDALQVCWQCAASRMLALAARFGLSTVLSVELCGGFASADCINGNDSCRSTRLSVSERGRLRLRWASRLLSSVLISRIRVMRPMMAIINSTNLIDAIIFCNQARTCSRSGTWAEVIGCNVAIQNVDTPLF